jgi:hypothetical protein
MHLAGYIEVPPGREATPLAPGEPPRKPGAGGGELEPFALGDAAGLAAYWRRLEALYRADLGNPDTDMPKLRRCFPANREDARLGLERSSAPQDGACLCLRLAPPQWHSLRTEAHNGHVRAGCNSRRRARVPHQ